MNCGNLCFKLEEILKEWSISKNQLCKALDIPRSNLNRYCRNEFQRIDANLICKLCEYLDVAVGDLIQYERAEKQDN